MREFFSGVGTVLSLELRQRVRGVAWYVLLGVFVALIALVTFLITVAFRGFGGDDSGGTIYSTIIYFVLLLGTLVAPALSGNAINGDRDAGTLATTQVTLITTWQLIVGKFVAAWITALAFLVAALPFIGFSALLGGLSVLTVLTSALVLAFELGFVAALGVAVSGIITRPLFSIVTTYLLVAMLSIGTLIAFALGGLVVQTDRTTTSTYGIDYNSDGDPIRCSQPETSTYPTPRFDLFWGVLVANPYVLLADAVPTTYSEGGYPEDLFGYIKLGVRSAQVPIVDTVYDACSDSPDEIAKTPQETIDSTVPGWFIGMLIHLALAVGALYWAKQRTTTPAGRLPRGSRVA
jgi:ABC-2 type transport system permease protein